MKFEFSQYQYQTDAANAVCDVFEGQPKVEDVSYIRDVGVRQPVFQSVATMEQGTLDAPAFARNIRRAYWTMMTTPVIETLT